MRILHIGKYYPPVSGGMERFLADLVAAQRAAGHEVAVLVHAHPRDAGSADPPWLMRCPVWLRLIFAPISPLFPFWILRALRTFQPDVIHIHMPNLAPFWALMLPPARRLPWVIQWQSDVVPSRFKIALRLAYPFYRLFERAMLERAECVIAHSPQYLASSAALQPWRSKCAVIPLGVDAARLPEVDPADAAGLWATDGLRVLAVGRLTYYKGFETLVRAAAGTPGVEVAIVGEGEERPRLERVMRRESARESVRLVGEADDTLRNRLMASCDVFCLPSRERTESFGIALVEAMRYGKPLLVGDVPGSGMSWVARHGENGEHVTPEDVPAWREALARMASDPARRARMGLEGRRRFLRDFDMAAIERRVCALYQGLLAAGEEDPRPAVPRQGRLLAVIPALNEADCIGAVISQARAQGADVLVVDDGSVDDTAAISRAAGATVISAPLWQGAWGAIQTGIRYARRHGYQGIVTLDADGQHEPAELPRMLEAAGSADVVIAACPARGSRLRQLAWSYFRVITGFSYEDLTSGFRYYNARACDVLAAREATLLDYQDIGVLLLLRRARLTIAEIPVAMNPRKSGASRVFYSWWTIAGYMAETTLLCLARWTPPRRRA